MYGKAARAPAPRPSTPGLPAATQGVGAGRWGGVGGRGRSAVQPRPHLTAAASAEGRDRPGGAQRGGPRSRGAVHPSLPGRRARAGERWRAGKLKKQRTRADDKKPGQRRG